MIKKKLKICHISFSDSKGGASKAAYKLHEYLKKENDLESYFFSRHNLNKDTIALNNSWTGKIRNFFALNISRLILYLFRDNISLNILPSRISNKLNSYKFDAFHLHWVNNETLSLNDLINLKKPLFITFHDMYYFNLLKNYSKELELKKKQLKKINFFKKYIFDKKKIFFKKKPIIFIPTHWLYNQFKLTEFFNSQKTHLLPYIFDYSNENKKRIKDNKINIGFVADRPLEDKRKNLKYTIDILNSLPSSLTKKIIFNIVGKINNIPKKNYNFKIKYFNFLSQNELKKFYKQNNFIFSLSLLENSSLVVLESLFSDTPVVTLKNTGPETLVKKINSELVLKSLENNSAISQIQNILSLKFNKKINYKNVYNNPSIYKRYLSFYNNNLPNNKKIKINVLHLSASFKEGGAFKAAREIFLMFQKIPNIQNKYYEFRKEVGLFKFYYSRSMDQKYFKKKINSYFSSGLNETFYIYGTKDFIEADVIVLYWINDGFLSIKELEKILSSGKKIIWRFSDMWPLTGGCHYSYECKKFITSCKACPQLYYNPRKDIVSKIFNEKLNWNTKNLTVVCPSHWIRSKVKLSKIFKNTKSITVHTYANEKIYNIKNKRELLLDKYSIPKNKHIVLYGSANFKLDYRKGYEYFKRSINYLLKKKKIDDFFFIFIGEKKLELESSKLNYKNFRFIKDKIQLSEIYNLADMFLFTSIEENFSNMVLESLNCGTPVVAFNVGGNKEIIKNGINGYLQNKISHFELDKIILKTNKLNRIKISQSIINKFNQKITIRKYRKILNESK